MGKPLFCPDNFFNSVMYTGHTLSANEAATGAEAFRVGTSRRSSRNKWEPTTANNDAWIKVACDRIRTADFIAIDRGHNLDGETVRLEGSNDDFTTKEQIFSITLPSAVHQPAKLDQTPGVKTEEGAWLYRFDARSYKYWRLFIPAMGAGETPKIVGLYLGQSWEPSFLQRLPFTFGARELIYETTVSDTAWVGSSRPAQRFRTDISLRLEDHAEYDLARLHVETRIWRKKPTWYVPDQDRAERSWLGEAPQGTYRFEQAEGWGYMQTTFPLVEYEPALI